MIAGDLVRGLVTSTDEDSSSQAIKKADAYLQRDYESGANPSSLGGGQDRTIINRGPPKGSGDPAGTTSAAASTAGMGRSFHHTSQVSQVEAIKNTRTFSLFLYDKYTCKLNTFCSCTTFTCTLFSGPYFQHILK